MSHDTLEVGVETIPERDVTAIVNIEGRLNKDILADLAKDVAEHFLPIGGEGLGGGVIREVVIVVVHEPPSLESTIF